MYLLDPHTAFSGDSGELPLSLLLLDIEWFLQIQVELNQNQSLQ